MINFVLFVTRLELFAQEIAHIQSQFISYDAQLVIIEKLNEFLSLIPSLNAKRTVVILFISSTDELKDLVKTKTKIGEIPSVIVLPDDQVKTFQRGMLLRPLYFFTKQDDPRHISIAIDELYYLFRESFLKLSNIS